MPKKCCGLWGHALAPRVDGRRREYRGYRASEGLPGERSRYCYARFNAIADAKRNRVPLPELIAPP